MANGIGFSFEPGQQSVPVSGSNRAVGGPQSAVEIKHLLIPNRFVPGQIAPQQLLQSAGGGGGLDVDILRRLMQAFAPQGQQPSVPTLAQSPMGPQQTNQPSNEQPASGMTWSGIGGIPGGQPPSAPPVAPPPVVTSGQPPRVIPTETPEPRAPRLPSAEPFDFGEPSVSYQSIGDRKRAGRGVLD